MPVSVTTNSPGWRRARPSRSVNEATTVFTGSPAKRPRKMLAPPHVEAAVGRAQRRDGDAALLEQRAPTRRRSRAAASCRRPARAPRIRRAPSARRAAWRSAARRRRPSRSSGGARGSARPPRAAGQPGAQQGRRLHVCGKHAARASPRRSRCRGPCAQSRSCFGPERFQQRRELVAARAVARQERARAARSG